MTFRGGSLRRFLALAFLLSACGSGLPENTATGPPPRPGPRPGSSITHTKMCECSACAEAQCCKGAPESEPSAKCESDDFSGAGCGLQVASCESRCYARMWRVRLDQTCAEKRPAECC